MRTVSVRLNDADSVRLDALARLWVMEPGEAMRKLIRDRAALIAPAAASAEIRQYHP